MKNRAKFFRDEDGVRAEIHTDEELKEILGTGIESLEPHPINMVDVFYIPQVDLLEQILDYNRHHQQLADELFGPDGKY